MGIGQLSSRIKQKNTPMAKKINAWDLKKMRGNSMTYVMMGPTQDKQG